MSTKTCTKCQKEYDEIHFGKKSYWCKFCWSEYRKSYYKKNIKESRRKTNSRRAKRVEWLSDLKSNQPCSDCGKIHEPFCMDFDHLYDKKKSISRMVLENSPKKDILKEIEKCELVCVLCHNVRTQKRQLKTTKYRPHVQRNIEIINKIKNTPCAMCGSVYQPFNMHFDHVNPKEKKKNISQLKSASLERLTGEIDKCQVLCALCHRKKSILDQRAGLYPPRKKEVKKKLFYNGSQKECCHCEKILDIENFCKSSKTSSKRQSWCKKCTNEYKKKKRKDLSDT